MIDYGYKSPEWMLKALLTNAPREHVNTTMYALVDYITSEDREELTADFLLELLAQVGATGVPRIIDSSPLPDDTLTPEHATEFEAWLKGMPTAPEPERRRDDEDDDDDE